MATVSSADWLVVTGADGGRTAHEGATWVEHDDGALVITDSAGDEHRLEPGQWFSVQPSEVSPQEWSEAVEQAQAEEAERLERERADAEQAAARQQAEEAAGYAAGLAAEAELRRQRAEQDAAAAQRAADEAAAALLPAGDAQQG